MRCLFLIVLVILLVIVLCIFASSEKDSSKAEIVSKEDLIFKVEKGQTAKSISKALKLRDLILSSTLFQYSAVYYGLDKTLKPGTYILSLDMSMFEILRKIAKGDSIKHSVKVRECATSWELYKLLESHSFLENDIRAAALPEGIFAPDTYLVEENTKFSEILNLMKNRQEDILREAWSDRADDLPLSSKYALLTLASIIEAEAASFAEMPLISSVFKNRLDRGMRLQADPTVMYGQDLGNTTIRKKLSRSDLKLTDTYNTYRNKGLPPSPICNPSRIAIQAAANPIKTENLFFVLTQSGSHIFSTNFEDHKKNVLKYHKKN